ncbi:hypothetical protein Hanom_Chr06g00537191 [Helianthus anomalus]
MLGCMESNHGMHSRLDQSHLWFANSSTTALNLKKRRNKVRSLQFCSGVHLVKHCRNQVANPFKILTNSSL